MIVTPEMVEEYKKWWLNQGHPLTSTLMYVSVITRFVGKGIEVNQKTVDRFRSKVSTNVSSGALKSFFKFLVRKKQWQDTVLDIRFDRSKQTKRFPKSISEREITILINNMPTLKTKIFTIFLYELALRISEGIKIRWDDFNWLEWLGNKEEYGRLNLKNTKRGKFRVIPVHPKLMKLLYDVNKKKTQDGIPIGSVVFNFGVQSYVGKKDDLEQSQYEYIRHVSDYYRDILERVSKQHLNKKVTPHYLRHSKSQHLLDGGMSLDGLKSFLGHSSLSSTEIYAQASPEKVKKELKEYDINRVKPKSL